MKTCVLMLLLPFLQEADNLETIRAAVRPRPGECKWLSLPWEIDPAAAFRKAAEQGKPIMVAGGAFGSLACGSQ